jgi:hypothetical protein
MAAVTDSDLLRRMETDLEGARARVEEARRTIAEAQPQIDELEILIRGVRRYVMPETTTALAPIPRPEPEPENGVGAAAPEPPPGASAPRWTKDTSIRSAAIQILGRTPGQVVPAHTIAATLLSEGYPYTGDTDDPKRRLAKLRETVAAVLIQHINAGYDPPLGKPEPARFTLLQTDVMAEQENMLDGISETAETPRANAVESTVSET